jgi:hypothetical protein
MLEMHDVATVDQPRWPALERRASGFVLTGNPEI